MVTISIRMHLVQSIIQTNNAVIWNRSAQCSKQKRRAQRTGAQIHTNLQMFFKVLSDVFEVAQIPLKCGNPFQSFFQAPDRVSNIADHFQVREVHLIDLSPEVVNMDHFSFVREVHEERRFLNNIMADLHPSS